MCTYELESHDLNYINWCHIVPAYHSKRNLFTDIGILVCSLTVFHHTLRSQTTDLLFKRFLMAWKLSWLLISNFGQDMWLMSYCSTIKHGFRNWKDNPFVWIELRLAEICRSTKARGRMRDTSRLDSDIKVIKTFNVISMSDNFRTIIVYAKDSLFIWLHFFLNGISICDTKATWFHYSYIPCLFTWIKFYILYIPALVFCQFNPWFSAFLICLMSVQMHSFFIWDSNSSFEQYLILGDDNDATVRLSALHFYSSVI